MVRYGLCHMHTCTVMIDKLRYTDMIHSTIFCKPSKKKKRKFNKKINFLDRTQISNSHSYDVQTTQSADLTGTQA